MPNLGDAIDLLKGGGKLKAADPQATHTRAIVEFYAFDDTGLSGSTDDPVLRKVLGSLVGVTTRKEMGEASGTFAITLKKPEFFSTFDYYTLWPDPESTWVKIKFLIDGEVVDTMIGIVDTLTEQVVRSREGQRTETYTLHGRDFGKVLETTALYLNPYAPDIAQQQSILDVLPKSALVGSDPGTYIKALLETWVGNSGKAAQSWKLPKGLGKESFYAYLDLRNVDMKLDGQASSTQIFSLEQAGTPLWETLQQYANGAINELWCDLGFPQGKEGKLDAMVPCLYLREKPFKRMPAVSSPLEFKLLAATGKASIDKNAWEKLPLHELDPSLIQKRQVARGAASSRFNYWMVLPDGVQGAATAVLIYESFRADLPNVPSLAPIVNRTSIQRHGLRRYEATSNYFPTDNDSNTESIAQLAKRWTQLVHDWYAPAPYQFSGTIVTSRVQPQIRIGSRVRETKRADKEVTYYVEGVEHSWQWPHAGSTTLTLTHGEFEGEYAIVDVYKQLAEIPAVPVSVDLVSLLTKLRPDPSIIDEIKSSIL